MEWFEQELDLARSEGVTHPGNFPFLLLPATPNGRSVLLIHGFSSSPREMRPLGDYLVSRNFTVYGLRLPGHGTSPEDLAVRTLDEWLTTVQRGHQALQKMSPRVSVAGLSTGALLALKLALLHPLDSLILLSPFLRLRHVLAPYVGLLSPLIRYQHKIILPEEQPFYYQRRPLKGVLQINRLVRELRGQLQRIIAPALVLTTEGDATIARGTAEKLFNMLGGEHKFFHCYGPEAPHVLLSPSNPLQQDVLDRCTRFLDLS